METAQSASSLVSPAAPRRLCRQCKEWEIAPSDAYCSYCGLLQLPIELEPKRIALNLDKDRSRRLVFSNEGAKPVTLEIVPKQEGVPWIKFEPPLERRLEPGKQDSLKVSIEEKELPKNLQVKSVTYQCRVDKNPRQTLEFEVEVTGPPRPELRPGIIDFGQVVAGKPARRELELTNKGGSPLILQRPPEVIGSHELVIEASLTTPLRLDADQKVVIPLTWKSSAEEDPTTESAVQEGGVKLFFAHTQEPVVVRTKAARRHQLLHTEPAEITVNQVLPKYAEIRTLKLENRGTVALDIHLIQTAATWIEIEAQPASFRLTSPHAEEASAPTGKDLPEVGNSCEIPVRLCPQKAGGPGSYQAEIQILAVGNEVLASVPVAMIVLEPRPFPGSVGIDFGTTNSVVSLQELDDEHMILVADRSLEDAAIPDAHPHFIPSVLVFDNGKQHAKGSGTYWIGRRAKAEVKTRPDSTVRSVKRLVGSSAALQLQDRAYKPEEIATLILRRLIEYAERQLLALHGEAYEIREAVVTVPSAFFDAQIQAIEAACQKAGITVTSPTIEEGREVALGQSILYEPAAAALFFVHYLRNAELAKKVNRPKGLNLLIYDHGGGTLDLALARVSSSKGSRQTWKIEIIANLGSAAVGGDTFDLIIMEELLKRIKHRDDLRRFDPQLFLCSFSKLSERARRDRWAPENFSTILGARDSWKNLAEQAKIKLSTAEEVTLEIPPEALVGFDEKRKLLQPDYGESFKLARRECEANLEKQFEACVSLVQQTLRIAQRIAHIKPEQMDYVIHAGRQSLMPKIEDLVKTTVPYGVHLRDEECLKVCVAKGAVLFGHLRDKGVGGIVLVNAGRVLPFSYGYEDRQGVFRKFRTVVPIGRPYPTTDPIVHSIPAKRLIGKRHLHLKIFQNSGESYDIPHKDIRYLDTVEIVLPDDREADFLLCFEVDANRRLIVSSDLQRTEIKAQVLDENRDEWIG